MPPKRKRDDAVPPILMQVGSSTGTYVVGYDAAPEAAPTTPKRAKKVKKHPDTPVEEKRLARFRASCPKNIQERVDRVMTQRFFMIERERDGDELRETFKVLGSTGNVYTVVIDKVPACDCPDFLKGNHCKHILFVFLKVLGVSPLENHYYQKALLSTELAEVFNSAPAAPSALAAERVRQAYANSTNGSTAEPPKINKRLPEEGDDCPICYEAMPVGQETGLVFCRACGNPLHKECFQQWAKTGPAGRTCVTCRAPWPHGNAVATGDKASVGPDGYVNMAHVAGISPQRDTSTYYHGPRRGQRYSEYEIDADRYL